MKFFSQFSYFEDVKNFPEDNDKYTEHEPHQLQFEIVFIEPYKGREWKIKKKNEEVERDIKTVEPFHLNSVYISTLDIQEEYVF